MSVFYAILVRYVQKVSKTVEHIEIVIFQMKDIGQPNQCCFVIVASLEAIEHDPRKLYCKKIFSEIVRTVCNAVNIENQGNITV